MLSLLLGLQEPALREYVFPGGTLGELAVFTSAASKQSCLAVDDIVRGVGPVSLQVNSKQKPQISISPSYSRFFDYEGFLSVQLLIPAMFPFEVVDNRPSLRVTEEDSQSNVPLNPEVKSMGSGMYYTQGSVKLKTILSSYTETKKVELCAALSGLKIVSSGWRFRPDESLQVLSKLCGLRVLTKENVTYLTPEPGLFKLRLLRSLEHFDLQGQRKSFRNLLKYRAIEQCDSSEVVNLWENPASFVTIPLKLSPLEVAQVFKSYDDLVLTLSPKQRDSAPELNKKLSPKIRLGYRGTVTIRVFDKEGKLVEF